ncbi:MAG: glycoside hydrolase family 78 protein [Opitutaceae bacterium]|nr:glycoside hydrolase family 78 protein [Opitutaceae bacterium]
MQTKPDKLYKSGISLVLALASFASATAVAAAPSPVRVQTLRCEYRENPEGIDETCPRLSWQLGAGAGAIPRGVAQTAFQVLVASSAGALALGTGDLWDSGWVASDRSIHIEYAGAPLASRQLCFWKVRVRDERGRESAWSAPARWSMGLLAPSDWSAQWIGTGEIENGNSSENKNHALTGCSWIGFSGAGAGAPKGVNDAPGERAYRRVFELPAGRAIASATLHAAADNSFVCHINGAEAARDSSWKIARARDVSAFLRAGKNTLAFLVTNQGAAPNPAGLAATLEIIFAGAPAGAGADNNNDSKLVIGTGGEWKCFAGETPNWQTPAFDDSAWPSARVLGKTGIAPWGEIAAGDGEFRVLPARHARAEFEVPPAKKIIRATLYASGLGLSEFYMNGEKIGDHVLSPGLTHYTKRAFYVTHDVTAKIRAGKNALAAWLGNGRHHAPRTVEPAKTLDYGHPKLVAQLEIEYNDGTRDTIATGARWRITDQGPITANNEYDGETYDARRELTGWASPGYDDSAWRPAALVAPPGGVLSAQMAEPIRVTQNIRPIAITEPEPGAYIFDMGQNMVGWTRLAVRGSAGTIITMRHAETLRPDGTLYMDNIRGAKVTGRYLLKGAGAETYEPRFTYYGFRYVEVTGLPEKPTLDTLLGRVVHDDIAGAGEFETSSPVINKTYANIRWGTRGNYRSMPTDCPQRDERQGWLGDRSEECKGESYLFDIAALYTKWLQDMRDAQRADGSIPDVCPPYWPLYNDNVTWPSTSIIAPDALHTYYGDTRVIARNYEAMSRWMRHMAQYIKNGIMSKDNYGDWCVPPEDQKLIHSKDPARVTARPLLATAYYYHCLKLMARHAIILNKTADAGEYNAGAEVTRNAFNKKYHNAGKGIYDNGTQTSSVLPLAFGLVPAGTGARERVFNNLVSKITNETRGHIGTGLVGGQWLNRVLAAGGRPDISLGFATQTDYPSWGYMAEKGATTIWELWNGDTADPAMNSGNHVMLVGDLVIWLYETLAGIAPDPAVPGFKHIIMSPVPLPGLTFVHATHNSPYGLIESEWETAGAGKTKSFNWRVAIPANTTATLRIPSAGAGSDEVLKKITESDAPLSSSPHIKIIGAGAGGVTVKIPSGKYDFQARQ